MSHPGSIAEMCDTMRPQYFPVHRADKRPQVQAHTPGLYRAHKDSLDRTTGSLTKLQTKAASCREGRTVSHTPLNCTHRGQEMGESEVHQAGAGCPLGTQVHLSVKHLSLLALSRPLLVSAKSCRRSLAKEEQAHFIQRVCALHWPQICEE